MPGPVYLRGDDVTLHTANEDDVEFLQRLINDPDVWPSLGRYDPVTESEEQEWVEEQSDHDGVNLVVCVEDEPVGSVGLTLTNETWGLAELGYMIAPDAQGNGYATDAARRLVRYGFEDRRLHKIIANAFGTNHPSQRVLEKAGFDREGVLRSQAYVRGEYLDVHRYAILEGEFEPETGIDAG